MSRHGEGEGKREGRDAEQAWTGDEPVPPEEFEEAMRFVHNMAMRTAHKADHVQALLMSVIKALVDSGELERDAFDRAMAEKKPDAPMPRDVLAVQLGAPVDKYAQRSPPDLDCVALHPICKARCCRLTFPLSEQDLVDGRLAWDYARPYHMRKDADHACVHQDRESGRCTVYEYRPAVCRTYDCREDKRIWLDFEKRILAPMEAVKPVRSEWARALFASEERDDIDSK